MTLVNGSNIYEILHKKEYECREEGRQEGETNVMNAIESLENQGKTPDEIITTLKTTF